MKVLERLLGGRTRAGAPADPWSMLFARIAACSFLVLVATGVFLMVYFDPSMARVTYEGSYTRLQGVQVSKAYASMLHISFDVRGGLLMRQVHNWAMLTFTAAICLTLVRMFVTGAFRRPRTTMWLIWVAMLLLAMATGVTGTLLPDDMLSGGSLSLIQGVTQSIPLVGTRLTWLIFGGEVPGTAIIGRAYWLHFVVLPLAIAGLFALYARQVRGHRHARPARGGPTPFQVAPRATSAALFLFTCAVLFLLGTLAQISPIWMYGPYEPGGTTAGAVPDWYMGFLDGAIRIMPGWELDIAGHPLTLAVLVPALLVPGVFMTVIAAYPWLERKATGDTRVHHVLDRPRAAATRTGVAAALIAFYLLLWAAASNDEIAVYFHLSLYQVTEFFRFAVFAGPVLAYAVTRAICQALVRQEQEELSHGRETGRIVMTPEGGFEEIHEPVRRELVRGA